MRSFFSSLTLAALFAGATIGLSPQRTLGAAPGSDVDADLAATADLDPTLAGDSNSRTARLQVIHNAADPAAAVVDVYVNGELFKDDFAFRTATPFVRVPAGVTLNVAVAPGNSGSVADAIATFPVMLERGKRYVAIANGILGQGFAANPDGRSISFTLFARDGVRARSGESDEIKLLAFHGATDAPTVDVLVRGKHGSQVLFDNLAYGDFSQYVTVEDEKYILDVTPGADNSTVVASFDADLRTLGRRRRGRLRLGLPQPSCQQWRTGFRPLRGVAERRRGGTAGAAGVRRSSKPSTTPPTPPPRLSTSTSMARSSRTTSHSARQRRSCRFRR